MEKIICLIFGFSYLFYNAQGHYSDNHFYNIYNGTSTALNIGLYKHFKTNLFLGLNANMDYLMKSKDLGNQYGKHYLSYETNLNFGYGKKSKSYFSYSIGLGLNINPGMYERFDEFGSPLGSINRKNSIFSILNINYNRLILKNLYFSSGISLKTRRESYHYEDSIGSFPEPYWGVYLIPSLNFGLNFVL